MRLMDLNLVIAVLATLTTVLMIGLGFLRSPSRATRLWALAFTVTMVGFFGLIAAETAGIAALEAACMGAILTTPTLLCAGVRAKFGKPSRAWAALVQGAASVGLLVALVGTPWYSLGFRLAFAVAATFAALTAVEMLNVSGRRLAMLLPLIIASVIFPLLALASLILTVRSLTDGSEDPSQMLTVTLLAVPAYLVCAVVSLLYLSTADVGGRLLSAQGTSRVALNDRLARAEARQESSWSLLYVTLDDVPDIRAAVGDAAFQDVIDRFASQVRAAFPTEADIEFRTDTTALVLLTRPDASIRANVRNLLNAVSTLVSTQPLAVQMSASVGWATTATTGYGREDLIRVASAAAVDARLAGGDRWVRVQSGARAGG